MEQLASCCCSSSRSNLSHLCSWKPRRSRIYSCCLPVTAQSRATPRARPLLSTDTFCNRYQQLLGACCMFAKAHSEPCWGREPLDLGLGLNFRKFPSPPHRHPLGQTPRSQRSRLGEKLLLCCHVSGVKDKTRADNLPAVKMTLPPRSSSFRGGREVGLG